MGGAGPYGLTSATAYMILLNEVLSVKVNTETATPSLVFGMLHTKGLTRVCSDLRIYATDVCHGGTQTRTYTSCYWPNASQSNEAKFAPIKEASRSFVNFSLLLFYFFLFVCLGFFCFNYYFFFLSQNLLLCASEQTPTDYRLLFVCLFVCLVLGCFVLKKTGADLRGQRIGAYFQNMARGTRRGWGSTCHPSCLLYYHF